MVQFAKALTFLLAAVSVGSAAVIKRDAAALKDDIATLSTQLETLHASITGFPDTGGSIIGALAIHNNAVAVDDTIQEGTTEALATGPLSDTDGVEILESLQDIKPLILAILVDIVSKKPAFDALPLGGISSIVLADLTSLDANTATFADALIEIAPADLVEDSVTLKEDLGDAFDVAIAAYTP